jgi:hypothetical protein
VALVSDHLDEAECTEMCFLAITLVAVPEEADAILTYTLQFGLTPTMAAVTQALREAFAKTEPISIASVIKTLAASKSGEVKDAAAILEWAADSAARRTTTRRRLR